MKQDIFVSTDVEADSKVPGVGNLLSFASAAFDIDKNLVSTFSRNLELLPNSTPDEETMKWWFSTPENKTAYDETRKNIVSPKSAFGDYNEWLKSLPGSPVFVGYPAAYDFKWIDYYSNVFTGANPFGFSRCIDVKSYAWAILNTNNFAGCTKKVFPKMWFDKLPHTHVALDDAIEQGAMFINMHRENLGLERLPDVKV